MAALTKDYNPDDVSDDFALCPEGEGVAQAINSKISEIDNVGTILNIEYEFLDGPLAGKRAFDGIFLAHSNPQVVEIGDRSLKRLCTAVGHTGRLADSDSLHFKPFRLKVTIKPDKKGIDRNNFAYSPIGQATTQAASTGAGQVSRPWGSKAA